jgi:hypothetical protein
MALLPCVGFIVWQRQWSAWRWFLYWPGLLLCGVIAMAWPATILLSYPDAANLWWLHTFGRLDEHGVLGSKPAWYYLTTVPWQIAPWTLFAFWAAIPSALRAWRGKAPIDRFMWVWLVLPLAALSAVAGKHPHYLIYALPPCSIWAAEGLVRGLSFARGFFAPAWRIRVAASLGLAGLVGFAWWAWASQVSFGKEGVVLGGISLLGVVAATWSCRRAHYRLAGVSMFATLWLAVIYLQQTLVPRTDLYREENALYQSIVDRTDLETPVLVYRMDPGQALFYCKRPIEWIPSLEKLRSRLSVAPQALVVTQALFEPELCQLQVPVRLASTTPSRRNPESQFVLYRMERLAISTTDSLVQVLAPGPVWPTMATLRLVANVHDASCGMCPRGPDSE